jgi:NADH dehydrogenase (ubiquinone) 1 alpha subcomplex subunit 9
LPGQAAGEKAVLEELPEATIFKTGPLVGVEDRLLNRIANLAKTLPAVPLIDGGATRMQPVYVRDVTNAMMNSLKSRDVLGQTYYLGGPKVFTCVPPMLLCLFVLALCMECKVPHL